MKTMMWYHYISKSTYQVFLVQRDLQLDKVKDYIKLGEIEND